MHLASLRARRVTTSVAAGCAAALGAGLVTVVPQTAATGAPIADPSTAPAAKKVRIAAKGVPYRCKATNSVVNQAIGGPQKFLVNGRAAFAGTFKPGTKITPKRIRLTLILPRKLTRKVRRQLGVRRVRGRAIVKFDMAAKPGGVSTMPVKGLRSGWRTVPKNKRLRIPAKGRAGTYRIRKRTKKLRLLAPRRFMLRARLRPAAVGIVKSTDIRCRSLSKRGLGTFPV